MEYQDYATFWIAQFMESFSIPLCVVCYTKAFAGTLAACGRTSRVLSCIQGHFNRFHFSSQIKLLGNHWSPPLYDMNIPSRVKFSCQQPLVLDFDLRTYCKGKLKQVTDLLSVREVKRLLGNSFTWKSKSNSRTISSCTWTS
jgi:hypothetical protein